MKNKNIIVDSRNMEVVEFQPRKLDSNRCKCENREVIIRNGRVVYTYCPDCKESVCG
jgi:hypothetical protein